MHKKSNVENLSSIGLPSMELPCFIDHIGEHIKAGFKTTYTFNSIIGESGPMDHARKLAQRFTASSANILLIGESGTGKELFAEAIHNHSRPSGSLIVLNCAAIPKNLIESELFGYDGGAFTGANRSGNQGKIELAHKGTLFLDEIGDMPLETQAVLLRVLENKQVMRIGGNKYRPVDFRLIAATNKDLQLLVNKGLFRLDLYYRLSVLTVNIPPLRQRDKDIIILADLFLRKYHKANIGRIPIISIKAKAKLLEYSWPGNVRQLENAIIYALNVIDDDVILPEHLPAEISYKKDQQDGNIPASAKLERLNEVVTSKEAEKIAIQNALGKANNNIALAADLLGMSKATLYRKVKSFESQK